jgi:hypothetical protein
MPLVGVQAVDISIWGGGAARVSLKQGGRVRSLFGLLHSSDLEAPQTDCGEEIEGLGMPGTASVKIMVVILLIGIASPFLG